MPRPHISVSIVSHGQAPLVHRLLRDLDLFDERMEVILTLNVPEALPFRVDELKFRIKIIRNNRRKGFGANHNQAFLAADGEYFCVLNPDVRLSTNPFPPLVACLQDRRIGVVAPKIVGQVGTIEDSARRFPTPLSILRKSLGVAPIAPDYSLDQARIYPDWVGGMFMLFRSDVFAQIQGFNERFFLYYEDVDLCARLWLRKWKVGLCPNATAVHDARRQSHHNIKYLKWHLCSMMKFFLSPVFIKVLWSKR